MIGYVCIILDKYTFLQEIQTFFPCEKQSKTGPKVPEKRWFFEFVRAAGNLSDYA